MMCPFSLLKMLAEAFGLNQRASGSSPGRKTERSNRAKETLSLWREFVRTHPRLPLDESDVAFAERIFAGSTLSVAHYTRLEQKYPHQVGRSRSFMLGEVASLIRFCRETNRPDALQFAYNICFSFQEILAVLEIILCDLSEDLQVTPGLIHYTRKVLLNNATHHNSLGGGMLHLYMKYVVETKQPVFQRGTLAHTKGFQSYAVTRMVALGDELARLRRLDSWEECEYQLSLLNNASDDEDVVGQDSQALLHFASNFFHGRERLGCPYLRSKNLIGFVEGVLNPFRSVLPDSSP